MDQEERRIYLIKYLLSDGGYDYPVPSNEQEQKRLLRSLMNVRPPRPVTADFLAVQDEYLRARIIENGVVDADTFDYDDDICLWQGDITRLKIDAIVNAANDKLLGCFAPCHYCIDNCIHTFAGVQLRLSCNDIMIKQGHDEPTGIAKITPAFNLPSKWVIHTVGPIIQTYPSKKQREQLASCYENCLKTAEQAGAKSIAFCCISTGVFSFPLALASEIAVLSVKGYKRTTGSKIKVVFDVFSDEQRSIYAKLLEKN